MQPRGTLSPAAVTGLGPLAGLVLGASGRPAQQRRALPWVSLCFTSWQAAVWSLALRVASLCISEG